MVAGSGVSGTGATATVIVNGSGQITSAVIEDPGTAYAVGDELLIGPLGTAPGSGSGGTVQVTALA